MRAPAGPTLCRRCEAAIEAAPAASLRADAIDDGFAALPYTGAGRKLVAALKFGRLRSAADLAAALIEARDPAGVLSAGVLVPVPASPLRLARRGMDPAREIAVAVAARTGATVTDPLRRRDLRRQRGGGRERRMRSPPRIRVSGPLPTEVVLVDDVVTTGATVDACARALRRGGAERVRAVALAAVPASRAGGRGA
ncbi:MAG: phosphoribosyltransferase family protein [Solirubrobacterales bacterium]